MTDLHELTALEQARAIRRREVSSLELTEHYLARTDALDVTVGAFITRTDDLARDAARAADERVAGADPDEPLGPLFGTVVPVKDLNFVAGVRCTLGSVVYDIHSAALVGDSLGLAYDFDCISLSIAFNETRSDYSDIVASRQIWMRLDLRTLGAATVATDLNSVAY